MRVWRQRVRPEAGAGGVSGNRVIGKKFLAAVMAIWIGCLVILRWPLCGRMRRQNTKCQCRGVRCETA